MSELIRKEKIYFANLDGLRFLAFFAVFLHHSIIVDAIVPNPKSFLFHFCFWQKENGALGVNLFFVLSGFLITYLLLKEKQKFNTIHVLAFYLRRILRIWPLYLVIVLIGFWVFPLCKLFLGEIPKETHNPVFYFLFAGNFEQINNGFADSSILNVLWSVCIEEQFYLVWPLLILIFPIKLLPHLFIVLICSTLVFRSLFYQNVQVLYYHTFSVFSDMIVGGFAAWLSFNSSGFLNWLKKINKLSIIGVYVFFIALIAVRPIIFVDSLVIIERLVFSLFFAFVILEQNYSNHSFVKMSNLKRMSKWGIYTYGLYCIHSISLLITHITTQKFLRINDSWIIMLIDIFGGLLITMGIAYVSYHYFEKFFLNYKDRFSYFLK